MLGPISRNGQINEDLVHMQYSDNAHAMQLDGFARSFAPALKKYFQRRGCQDATVQDLVQQVFLRLAQRSSDSQIENPEAYLMQTASSTWNDYLRKRKSHKHTDHIEYEDNSHALEDFPTDRVLEGREEVRRVLGALEMLPERVRQIFVLSRIEGLRQKDIAARLGVSVSTVEKDMVKAVVHLSGYLGAGA